MKKSLFVFAFFFIFITILFANDAYVVAAGGNILPFDGEKSTSHPTISMKSELIQIELLPEKYHVHVDFEFFNDGTDSTIKVGFPQWKFGTTETSLIENFKSTLNGQPQSYEIMDGGEILQYYTEMITKWFVREITFPENSITKTSVDYDCAYSHQGYYKGVDYLFGTGKTWKTPIGTQTIEITNRTDEIIQDVIFREGKKYVPVKDRADVINQNEKIIISRNNVNPQSFDCIFFELSHSYYTHWFEEVDESSWTLNNKLLTEADLVFFTKEQLRLYRNLIFAWHGNIFSSKDLNAWLKNQYWYTPTHKVEISELSEIEKKNLEAIQKEEARRK